MRKFDYHDSVGGTIVQRENNCQNNPKELFLSDNTPFSRLPQGFCLIEKGVEAFELIKDKEPFIFLTGRAGTGKSTFIQYVKENFTGNLVVGAPTGVAALNIQGQTIHSLFKFPAKPFQNSEIRSKRNELFENLDLLVIDEISMVRADLIDHMDYALKKWRKSALPFGGVQILAVGDLYQLPPIVGSEAEKEYFSSYYNTPWFFGANVFKNQFSFSAIEFDKIFRQSDQNFIEGLNRIRINDNHRSFVAELNNICFLKNERNPDQLILTATNYLANLYNEKKYRAIQSEATMFVAKMDGNFTFDERSYPAPELLELKEGTQVMITKNINGAVNGTIGTVVRLENEGVVVIPQNNNTEIFVRKVKWEQYSFHFNKENKRVESKQVGTYSQLPLRLGWAVTIHKSQGLTLDNVLIDLGAGAFAPGQTYVALSRCRSLTNIKLAKPIRMSDVEVDRGVLQFYKSLFY